MNKNWMDRLEDEISKLKLKNTDLNFCNKYLLFYKKMRKSIPTIDTNRKYELFQILEDKRAISLKNEIKSVNTKNSKKNTIIDEENKVIDEIGDKILKEKSSFLGRKKVKKDKEKGNGGV